MEALNTINSRIKEIRKSYKVSQESLAEMLNVSQPTITQIETGKIAPSLDVIRFLISKFDISYSWLIDGLGEMLKENDVGLSIVREPTLHYLRGNKRISEQAIPLYDFKASAGLVQLFNSDQTVINYIQIPNMPRCDGAIYVSGDSMYPLLKSGDIVAYKQVSNFASGILYGEMYLLSFNISDDDLTVVKYIQKSDKGSDFIRLVSYNQHHQPMDIPINSITALALVKVSIRMQSMS